MPEKKSLEETNQQQAKVPPPASPPSVRSSSSIPVLLSSLALLLAAFALAATLISSKNMGARQSLDVIKGNLSAMESRVSHMEALMAMDKRGLVQAELQKMLLNLHELSRLGDAETKAEISKAEAILLRLSTPATRVKAKIDLKTTEQGVHPDKKKVPARSSALPIPVKKPLTQNPQTTQAPMETQSDRKIKAKIEPKATPARPIEKQPNQAATSSPPDTGTHAIPVSPAPKDK